MPRRPELSVQSSLIGRAPLHARPTGVGLVSSNVCYLQEAHVDTCLPLFHRHRLHEQQLSSIQWPAAIHDLPHPAGHRTGPSSGGNDSEVDATGRGPSGSASPRTIQPGRLPPTEGGEKGVGPRLRRDGRIVELGQ